MIAVRDWALRLWWRSRQIVTKHNRLVVRTFWSLVIVTTSYAALINHVDSHEVGISWNFMTGNLGLQGGGFHFTWPWVSVSSIDTRPHRLCVGTAGRAIACRLVRFESAGYREFVATEGYRYYWWANRISFNCGHTEEYRGMTDILRGYAFSANHSDYRFIHIESMGP